MIDPVDALPGRAERLFPVPAHHAVLGTPLECPKGFPPDLRKLFVAMGCFWGAERRMWRLPGVFTTAVGYQGGYTPNPTYEEVCTGRTGHAETVLVVYDPQQLSTYDVLKVFWENHDPTQGYRQGNDIGTQYRSAVYWGNDDQREFAEATARVYQGLLTSEGLDPITTEIAPAEGLEFYYAEPEHQQYLHKNPYGYVCSATTGYPLPPM
jgi:peptide-methionine (S)-S-oxide reductase